MHELDGVRVAVLATDGFEESELVQPVQALQWAGASVDIVAPKFRAIRGLRHFDPGGSVLVDRLLDESLDEPYDALLLPGGAMNADALRAMPSALEIIRAADAAGKPIAAICHAPWELISAGVVQGRTLTSFPSIQDDLRNAGAQWLDQDVVVDGNLVTSRQPSDLVAFNREMIALFSRAATRSAPPADDAPEARRADFLPE